jgi:hypothetical protein
MADELTPLERAVLATILAPDHPVMDVLRRQFESCTVAGRQFTGHGFFTDLAVRDDVPAAPVTRQQIALGDVTGSVEGLHHGAGFVLFIRDGVLKLLEGFAYNEPWPDPVREFEITSGGVGHFGGSETDLDEVEAAWDRDG